MLGCCCWAAERGTPTWHDASPAVSILDEDVIIARRAWLRRDMVMSSIVYVLGDKTKLQCKGRDDVSRVTSYHWIIDPAALMFSWWCHWFEFWSVNPTLQLNPRPQAQQKATFQNILRNYIHDHGFLVFATSRVAWQFQTDLLSSIETGANFAIRSWKKHLSDWAQSQKAVGGIFFTKKWRVKWSEVEWSEETVKPGLEFDNFKPGLKAVSSNASPGWTVRFWGVMIKFIWKMGSIRPI
jgi:hypothetical protein